MKSPLAVRFAEIPVEIEEAENDARDGRRDKDPEEGQRQRGRPIRGEWDGDVGGVLGEEEHDLMIRVRLGRVQRDGRVCALRLIHTSRSSSSTRALKRLRAVSTGAGFSISTPASRR